MPEWLHVLPEVQAALDARQPVVALESTVITHGLPRPVNLDLARRMEGEIRRAGATPATAALVDGRIRFGLLPDELERLEGLRRSRRSTAAISAR